MKGDESRSNRHSLNGKLGEIQEILLLDKDISIQKRMSY